MSRLELPNGDWVDFVERLNYAQARRIQEAEPIDKAGTLVAALITNWALRDVEGNPIEFPGRSDDGIPLESLNRVPFDTFTFMGGHAADILPNVPDPKGTGGTSSVSARARPSASRRTSPTPTSSPTTRDGLGKLSGPPQPM